MSNAPKIEPSIDQNWRLFRSSIATEVDDPRSIHQLRCAYYAGFLAAYGAISELAVNATRDERNDGMDRMLAEAMEFVAAYGVRLP